MIASQSFCWENVCVTIATAAQFKFDSRKLIVFICVWFATSPPCMPMCIDTCQTIAHETLTNDRCFHRSISQTVNIIFAVTIDATMELLFCIAIFCIASFTHKWLTFTFMLLCGVLQFSNATSLDMITILNYLKRFLVKLKWKVELK